MITVLGEALIDLTVHTDNPSNPTAHPGGSPMNVAIGLARLGTDTTFLGRLSTDAFGQQLHRHLADSGVRTDQVIHTDKPTSLAIVTTDETGSASYAFHNEGTSNWQWAYGELPPVPFDTQKIPTAIHAGSLALGLEPGGPVLEKWLEQASGQCVISLDPNVRPSLVKNVDEYRTKVEQWISFSTIVKMSDEDSAFLWPGETTETLAAQWLQGRTALVVITGGAAGTEFHIPGGIGKVPAEQITVVDTIGAGDSFSSALLHWLGDHQLLNTRALMNIADTDVASAIAFASGAAAITCTRTGANPPWRKELQ